MIFVLVHMSKKIELQYIRNEKSYWKSTGGKTSATLSAFPIFKDKIQIVSARMEHNAWAPEGLEGWSHAGPNDRQILLT